MLGWLLKRPSWDITAISDEWFRAHFERAASIVHDWLSPFLNFASARLLDFGCGDGITDLGIALRYRPKGIIGVDVMNTFTCLRQLAAQQIRLNKLPRNLTFCQIEPGEKLADWFRVDAIFTWSAFEHVGRPYLNNVVADLFAMLPAGGFLFLQIEPLYYSPFGSHLGRFIKQPWVHLLWDEVSLEKAVMAYDGEIPPDEKEYHFYVRSFEEYKAFIFLEYQNLNRLTADELVELFCQHGFMIIREERDQVSMEVPVCLKKYHFEKDLLTNEIRLLLQRPGKKSFSI